MNKMETVNKLLRKARTKKALGLMIIAVLILSSPYIMSMINPGFEGAKCYFYGLYFPSGSWQGYSGTDTLHRYQDAESILVRSEGPYYFGSRTSTAQWTSLGTPNDAGVGYILDQRNLDGSHSIWTKPDLKIHVESNLQLQDINRQGDPLNWNSSEPMDTRRIEYWSKKAVKQSEVNDTANNRTIITYQYEMKKESFILSPVEFWVGYYLIPSQENANTGSGWREGEWHNIVVWFRLDFNTWDNAYKDPWLDDPQQNVFTSLYNGTILNEQKTNEYRGGFPICGWIQNWQKAGWTSQMSNAEGPVWATRKGKNGDAYYTADQLGQLKNELMSKVKIGPGMVGQFISLYNEPDVNFQYKEDLTAGDLQNNDALTNDVKAPDSTMHKVMYFPMNIENLGTLVKETGNFLGIPTGWDVYYPEAYFRVRMIYGVYGTFTYLWTEQVTQPWKIVDPVTGETTYPGGLSYPEKVEIAGTTIIHAAGPAAWTTGITDYFSQPTTLLWSFFIIMVIVIIIVSVANPGMWTAIAMSRNKGKARAKG